MTSPDDRDPELVDRIEKLGISEAAITIRATEMKRNMEGFSRQQWQNRAAVDLCNATEALTRCGATVMWP